MDEEKFKEIFSKANNDYSGIYDFFKSYYKEDYFSNRNVIGFSIVFSGLFTYKYLKNRIIYRENNGHFNSPQNLLNRKLTKNYWIEGTFRFTMGTVALYMGLNLFKIYYLKLEVPLLFNDPENEKQYNTKKDIDDILLIKEQIDSSDKDMIVKVGNESLESINDSLGKKLYGMNETLNFRNNINKYFEQYRKKT